jgi:hypothetical protein
MDASLLTITAASGNFHFSAEDNNPMSSNVPNRPLKSRNDFAVLHEYIAWKYINVQFSLNILLKIMAICRQVPCLFLPLPAIPTVVTVSFLIHGKFFTMPSPALMLAAILVFVERLCQLV